ncbi:hypothetical protein B566_EDAN015393 [Ephemera danica]|nr:hypothetical protein B566_EDAN015393 [Ephemera danica]
MAKQSIKLSSGDHQGSANKKRSKRAKKHKENANSLLINNAKQKWYEIPLEIPRNEVGEEVSNEVLQSLSQEAEELLLSDTTLYNAGRAKDRSSDYQWMQTVMAKGTTADKIAAHTVQVQDSPVHCLSILQNLIGMVKVGKKNECNLALDTLHELFISDLLIPGEKLRTFESRPLSQLSRLSSTSRKMCLLVWWFESRLKELYITYVRALDTLAREAVDSNKGKVIAITCTLLSENPEQEQLLLRQAVNKLGDPQQKVASKTMYCLTKVLEKHPNMQCVILDEVEKMLFRTNVAHKAQYYAICFLSQFKLHEESAELATNMIRVYFCFFKACIKKGDIDSRMLSVLLMGVNRAFPYAKNTLGDDLAQHIDTLHRLVHISPFNVSLHTLCLLLQVSEASCALGDRFYCSLYKKILDPHLLTTSHQAAFMNLVFKAIKNDSHIPRIRAFIKRLLQVVNYCPASLACSLLYLVSQVLARKKEARGILLEPVEYFEHEVKEEDNDDDDDDEEKYADVKVEDEAEQSSNSNPSSPNKLNPASSWMHRPTTTVEHNKPTVQRNSSTYDPLHRNPLFSGADKAVYLELTTLSRHFHPTVALFATNILEGKPIEYTGDPLQDFTAARFLERFVFKNPKKLEGGSQPSRFSRSKNYRPKGMKTLAVTSKSYLNEEESRIPCEEVYLYRYLQKKREPWLESEQEEKDDSDADSVASDEFEQLLQGGKLGGASAVVDDEQPDFADDLGGEFSSGDESDLSDGDDSQQKKKKSKPMKKSGKRKRDSYEDDDEYEDQDDLPDVFASAEEFADMLEDTGASTLDVQGSSGMANRDNAAVKQLHWEAARDQWIRGGGSRPKKNRNRSAAGGFNSNKKRRKR